MCGGSRPPPFLETSATRITDPETPNEGAYSWYRAPEAWIVSIIPGVPHALDFDRTEMLPGIGVTCFHVDAGAPRPPAPG